jgi:hypothetical protein
LQYKVLSPKRHIFKTWSTQVFFLMFLGFVSPYLCCVAITAVLILCRYVLLVIVVSLLWTKGFGSCKSPPLRHPCRLGSGLWALGGSKITGAFLQYHLNCPWDDNKF